MIDISVVILTWNSQQHIERCVSSVVDSLGTASLSYEIIIVDNGSSDGTITCLNSLKEKYTNTVNLVFLGKNTGTTYSRNIALRQAQGNYLAVLDSDVEVVSGVFDTLINKLEKDPSIGLIAPKLVYASGSLQKSTDKFPTVLSKAIRFFFLKKIEKAQEVRLKGDTIREVDYAISAFWLFPRTILKVVGYLDEKIFYAPEDVDYCLRIWSHNFKIVYDPSVSVVHYAQEISRGLKFNNATIEHVKGLFYLFKKHKYIFLSPKF